MINNYDTKEIKKIGERLQKDFDKKTEMLKDLADRSRRLNDLYDEKEEYLDDINNITKKRKISSNTLFAIRVIAFCVNCGVLISYLFVVGKYDKIRNTYNSHFLNNLKDDNVLYIDPDKNFYNTSNGDYKYFSGRELYKYIVNSDIDLFGVGNVCFTENGDDIYIVKSDDYYYTVSNIDDIAVDDSYYYTETLPYEELKDYNLYVDVDNSEMYTSNGEEYYTSQFKLIRKK